MAGLADRRRKKDAGDSKKNLSGLVQVDFIDSIVVLEELRAYIPPLRSEELGQLEANILKEGVRDPLIFWDKGSEKVLIDGHNRFGIIKENGLADFKVELLEFENIEAVKDWMINLQLGRRNLTNSQMSYLRGLQYEREKVKDTSLNLKNVSEGSESGVQNEHPNKKTSEKLAEEHNVSPATIRRDSDFAKGLERIGEQDADLKAKILSGEKKVKKGDVQAVGSAKEDQVDFMLADFQKDEKKKEKVQVSEYLLKNRFSDNKDLALEKLKNLSFGNKKGVDDLIGILREMR